MEAGPGTGAEAPTLLGLELLHCWQTYLDRCDIRSLGERFFGHESPLPSPRQCRDHVKLVSHYTLLFFFPSIFFGPEQNIFFIAARRSGCS